MRGHQGGVWDAEFSPDGKRIVTASEDRTARIWDAATGREIVVLRGHENWVWTAVFDADGSRIAQRIARPHRAPLECGERRRNRHLSRCPAARCFQPPSTPRERRSSPPTRMAVRSSGTPMSRRRPAHDLIAESCTRSARQSHQAHTRRDAACGLSRYRDAGSTSAPALRRRPRRDPRQGRLAPSLDGPQ